MSGYLLDTNVLSELLKKRPSELVLNHVRGVPRGDLYSSVICVMELRSGAVRYPNGAGLWKRIQTEVLSRVSILPVDLKEATKAGDLLAELEVAGTPIGIEDILIGATALVHGLTVATRNIRHFSRIEHLQVEDWWN